MRNFEESPHIVGEDRVKTRAVIHQSEDESHLGATFTGTHASNGKVSETPWPEPWAVVLAGGRGTRLQSFVRQVLGKDRPKQFCGIVGTRSMVRHTWDRAARVVGRGQIVTVITRGQERYLDEEARYGVPGPVLVQPANRETAAGLVLPLLWIARYAPTAIVAVFPADHFVWEEDNFVTHIRAAVRAAQALPDRLILLGVEAEGPETGYGWVAPGKRFSRGPATELYTVRRFWEKPGPQIAAHLFASGYLWNTLVLVGRVEAYLRLAEVSVPQVLGPLRAVDHCLGTPAEATALEHAYRNIPSTNLSRALLARHPHRLLVMAARGMYWSDWGDPHRIVRTLRRFDRHPRWLQTYAV